LFTWRHNVAPNIACKTRRNNVLLRALQLQLRSKQIGFVTIFFDNGKGYFFVFREIWYIFSLNMIKCRLGKIFGILSCLVKISSIVLSNEKNILLIYHISSKSKKIFFYLISLSKKNDDESPCLLRNCNCTLFWLFLDALFGATLWRRLNNYLNVCTAVMTVQDIFS
jgi:hypothetical protein